MCAYIFASSDMGEALFATANIFDLVSRTISNGVEASYANTSFAGI